MYKDDVKTIYLEKREALASFLGDSLTVLLKQLDDLFDIVYNNYQDIIGDYEDMIITKDTYRVIIPKNKVLRLDSELKKKYISELGGK